jgi:hypothetical protein
MTYDEFQSFLAEAYEELQRKQDALQVEYLIGTFPRWWFDQETAKLQFLQSGVVAVEADFIDVGSYSAKSSTWRWAWGNESVLPALRLKAERIRELEEITGFALFGNVDAFKIDESMAWELTAVAVKHLGAKGCYRAPSGGGLYTFLAITDIRKMLQ